MIADRHSSPTPGAGAVIAALYLREFLGDKAGSWAHLDIAGMVWSDKPGTHHDKGATGYGVRLLDRFVRDNVEQSSPRP